MKNTTAKPVVYKDQIRDFFQPVFDEEDTNHDEQSINIPQEFKVYEAVPSVRAESPV